MPSGLGVFLDADVSVSVDREVVNFEYTTAWMHSDFDVRPGILRYRIRDGRPIREAPIGVSYGAFIDEWLDMDDAEAARWSSPDALKFHHGLAERVRDDVFFWKAAADCPTLAPTREIEVGFDDGEDHIVFLMSVGSAEELRLLKVSDHLDEACREIDITGDEAPITEEPGK